jgi:hypothetical protein
MYVWISLLRVLHFKVVLLGNSKEEIFADKYQKDITNILMKFICAVFDQARLCSTAEG